MRARIRMNCVLTLAAPLLLGCGRGPATYDVSGTITYQGQPVADAQVGFVPAGGAGEVQGASGQTDAQGRYTLQTYVTPSQTVAGAMAGSFKVTVVKAIAENRIVEYKDLVDQKDTLPPRYASAKTTPLTATVSPDGQRTFNFELVDTE